MKTFDKILGALWSLQTALLWGLVIGCILVFQFKLAFLLSLFAFVFTVVMVEDYERLTGIWFGFKWVHCNGVSSKTSVNLAGYHHPDSITWRWALYWNKNLNWHWEWKFRCHNNGSGWIGFLIPFVGGLMLHWQAHMWKETEKEPRKIKPQEIQPTHYRLDWFTDQCDCDDCNGGAPCLAAASFNQFDEDAPMYYRLVHTAEGWRECSDSELLAGDKKRFWTDLDAAKAQLQQEEKEAMITAAESGDLELKEND